MTLGEKVRSLRSVQGDLSGLGREMSQHEVARAIRHELGESFSQSYLSHIESGARPHLTHHTRLLLARFFKVHPGYLVTDPPGYHTELTSALRTVEGRLDNWLIKGAEHSAATPLREAMLRLAQHATPGNVSCSSAPSSRRRTWSIVCSTRSTLRRLFRRLLPRRLGAIGTR